MMSKVVLMAKYNKEIAMYETYIKALKRTKEILVEKKCDNKVFNKRIATLLKENLGIDSIISISAKAEYSRRYLSFAMSNEMRWFRADANNSGYVDHSAVFECYVSVNRENERLILNETLENIDTEIMGYISRINELNDYIINYDAYMEANKKFKEMVEEYQKKIPYRMRYSVRLDDNNY